jgi:hypothetical protein
MKPIRNHIDHESQMVYVFFMREFFFMTPMVCSTTKDENLCRRGDFVLFFVYAIFLFSLCPIMQIDNSLTAPLNINSFYILYKIDG